MNTAEFRIWISVLFLAGVLCAAALAQQASLQGAALGSAGGIMQNGATTLTFSLGQSTPNNLHANNNDTLFSGIIPIFDVKPNNSPLVINKIPNQVLKVNAPFTRDLNASLIVFNDPDRDALTYTARSINTNMATASVAGSVLTVTPLAPDSTTITVTASDRRGGEISTSFTVFVYPFTFDLRRSFSFPNRSDAADYKTNEYQLIGLPGASNLSANNLFTGDQAKDWQVVWDNGAPTNYFVKFDGTANFIFSAGRAFWIIKKGNLNIDRPDTPAAGLNPSQEIELPVRPGWNMITNPYRVSIAWSKIQSSNSITERIYAFNGAAGYNFSTNFDPYVGYYYFETRANPTPLKIPFALYFSSTPTAASDQASWRVNMILSSGEFSDTITSFGVAAQARSDLDRLDWRKPRALAAAPAVEFKRPAWDANYSIFATDIRPEFEESESWEFDVQAISREAAQLAFSGIGKIPSRFEVYLLDAGRAQSANLREDSLYHFTPAAELMKFKIVVGRKEKVQEQLSALALPKEFALGPNYPNPFNPTTTIPMAIPVASGIRLKIYNLLGEEVRTVYDGSIGAGRYWFNWDGRNDMGNSATTGVYLYRLTASTGVTLAGKMILIR
jgi:hypothetical protein